MSISWQTGEPPCGQELLIEYRVVGNSRAWRDIARKNGIEWHIYSGPCSSAITILRWSTLDDDRSAMAMEFIEQNECDVTCDPRCAAKWDCENQDGSITGFSCTSALDAIEVAILADQQTKGATDEA